MKDKLFKKRIHIDWTKAVFDLEDPLVTGYFYHLLYKKKSRLSRNRCAYLALLHCYDKKFLDYYRLTSDITIFTRLNYVL